jgi:aminoglycoside phosphotransferase family enzyme
MELGELIEALSRPEAYPDPGGPVEIRHTHISVVFLAGPYAYKVKKPVQLGFLDFSTLEKRRYFCEQEVLLNRRLSPSVYLGVVPISRTERGIQMEAPGEAIEWAVKMERLPESATLAALVRAQEDEAPAEPRSPAVRQEPHPPEGWNDGGERGEILSAHVTALAKRLARFHAEAETSPHISKFGRLEVVAQNVHENFDQAEPLVGVTLSRTVFNRLRELFDEDLAGLGPLMESRAQRHVPRDTHGDLHLDHVYLFPERPGPPHPPPLPPGERAG